VEKTCKRNIDFTRFGTVADSRDCPFDARGRREYIGNEGVSQRRGHPFALPPEAVVLRAETLQEEVPAAIAEEEAAAIGVPVDRDTCHFACSDEPAHDPSKHHDPATTIHHTSKRRGFR
jgi:hypothetical protein